MLKLLPQLHAQHAAPVPTAGDGDWDRAGGGTAALAKYADALVVPITNTTAERLKSVPTPWARMLLFEQALFSSQHPVHPQVRDEWRGLLAVLGLQSYLGLSAKVEPVDLGSAAGVMGALSSMRPQDGDTTVWDRLGLIRLEDRVVGGTSPRTLVFTGIRGGVPAAVPFAKNGRFTDPAAYYLSMNDGHALSVLAEWLSSFYEALTGAAEPLGRYLGRRPGSSQALSVSRAQLLLKELESWRREIQTSVQEVGADPIKGRLEPLHIHNIFADGGAAATVYRALRAFVPDPDTMPRRNDLQLVGSDWLIDPGTEGMIRRSGQPLNGVVRLPGGQTRQAVKGKFTPPLGSGVLGKKGINLGRLFQPRLLEIAGREDSVAVLTAQGRDYLLPFAADILRVLPPDSLIEWASIHGDSAIGLTVALEVPLSGGLSVRYERRYEAGSIDTDLVPPQLLTWPDFQSADWNYYYSVSVQRSARGRLLTLAPALGTEEALSSEFRQPAGPAHWWLTRLPVRAWNGVFGGHAGLLLTKALRPVVGEGVEWNLAIDFGSTNSRVFRASKGAGGAKTSAEVLFQNRTVALIGGSSGTDTYFLSGPEHTDKGREEVPSIVWFPLLQPSGRTEDYLPADGVVHWNYLGAPPAPGGLRSNLKWQSPDTGDRSAFEAYITQLFLAAAAEAAACGARVRSFVTAYPSVLPNWLRINHRQAWSALAKRFNVATSAPISESAAVAKFFVGQGAPATHLLAIDIGGSTSDVAIWSGGRLVANDSIKMAGDILSRLVGRVAEVRGAVAKAARTATLNEGGIVWSNDDESVNRLIFNSLLRKLSIQGQTLDLASNLGGVGPRSPAERVLAHAGYLFATLSYVLGMMVRKVGLDAERYDLRLAGKASGLLRWVDVLGPHGSQSLADSFFRAGLNASSAVRLDITIPDADAKEEVGRGLLEDLSLDLEQGERRTFLGETGFTGPAGALVWDTELTTEMLEKMPEPVGPIPYEQLTSLKRFADTFDVSPVGRVIARSLDLSPAHAGAALEQKIHGAVFGPTSAFQAVRNGSTQDSAMLEPIFVTEAKVLLEHVTNNQGLFRA